MAHQPLIERFLPWADVAERPGREYVAGAATRRWEADVIFRPGIGIVAIRWLMLWALRREAEHQWRATRRAGPPTATRAQTSQGSFT